MTPAQKHWIDTATYEDLLTHWRFAPAGDDLFQGDTGEYYQQIMAERREDIGDAGHAAISKAIGWSR